MKKVILIISTVVVLIGATVYADRATRVKSTGPAKYTEKADAKTLGQPAPDVTFKDLDDKNATLSRYKGKVVLVNFWATWCEPCYIEIPWLIEMQQKYEAKGFTVLGISMDEDGDKFGGLLGYPTSFLISRDGKIVKKVQGLISYEELTKAIESQL